MLPDIVCNQESMSSGGSAIPKEGEAEGIYVVTDKSRKEVTWNVAGRYVLLDFVGSGSYGQVVRAHAVDDAAKAVIIKCTPDAFNVSSCITHKP
jgi:hypothetical protein